MVQNMTEVCLSTEGGAPNTPSSRYRFLVTTRDILRGGWELGEALTAMKPTLVRDSQPQPTDNPPSSASAMHVLGAP